MTAQEARDRADKLARDWKLGEAEDRADVTQEIAKGPPILAVAWAFRVVPGARLHWAEPLLDLIEAAQ